MKKGIGYRSILLFICILLSASWSLNAFAQQNTSAEYDFVFVLDESRSMKTSDAPRIMLQAVQLFANSVPAAVTRFGAVAYAGEVVAVQPLTTDKSKIQKFADSLKYEHKNTDVPIGLKEAKKLLEADGANDHEKIVIMLTDGKNEPVRTRKSSELAKDLADFESAGYKTYTIGLNCDGSVNKDYLKGIADTTGGRSYVTSTAKNLKTIFDDIFADIFQGQIEPVKIDKQGNFEVKNDDVVEAIVEIYHEEDITWKLTSPTGEVFTAPTDDISVNELDLYTAITVFNPAVGVWNISYTRNNSDDKTKIITTCVLSYNISVITDVAPNPVGIGGEVTITASVYDSQKQVSDRQDFFDRYSCKATIEKPDGTTEEISLQPIANGFSAQYIADQEGTYKVSSVVEGSRLSKKSSETTFATDASIPVAGTQNGSQNGEKDGLPWWVFVIIAVVAIVIIAVVVIIIKNRTDRGGFGKKYNLSGVISYEYEIPDLNESSPPVSFWNFDMMSCKKASLLQLFNNRSEFGKCKDIFLGSMEDETGKICVGIVNNSDDQDLSVSKYGMPVGKTPVVLNPGDRVEITINNPYISISISCN